MPIIKKNNQSEKVFWGIWLLEEDENDLLTKIGSQPVQELEKIKHPLKRKQWLASRALLNTLLASNSLLFFGVVKDKFDKPSLITSVDHTKLPNISISHCEYMAAAIVDCEKATGIDIETISDKPLAIGAKFMATAEREIVNGDKTEATTFWAAKEALYKLYGRKKLIFKENLRIFPTSQKDRYLGEIRIKGLIKQIDLQRVYMENKVIVYTL